MRPITGTYRLQLRPDAFTLGDAAALIDYLDALGVSHLYLSPILTATSGSTHGYDVTDPTTVADGLGGRAALVELSRAARAHDMGLIVDIVPNHVGVAKPRENRWWWDVLTYGRASSHAHFFDIDWEPDNGAGGRLALPVLGSPEDVAMVSVDRSGAAPLLAFHEHRFPLAPGTDSGSAQEIHARQSYRLVPWNAGIITYRRFFAVNELAALRQEDPEVFEVCHRELKSWADEGLIDGVRIDHPDGLADPVGYLHRLRALLGPDQWIVIEKILAPGEPLDPMLPVDGTTGYDALDQIGGVLVDPAGAPELTALSRSITGDAGDRAWIQETEHRFKCDTGRGDLAPEVGRLVRVIQRETGGHCDDDALREAVVSALALISVYRSDYSPLAGSRARIVGALYDEAVARGCEVEALDTLVLALAGGGEASVRFQQVCGAVMAKSVEDRLFYRTARLISRQDVGCDPSAMAVSVAEFHLTNADRARWWPRTMTTLSTHDTKRGEDVRARIGVLSQMPTRWSRFVREWEAICPSPDPLTGLFLWQTIIGVWPADGSGAAASPHLRSRLHSYAEKAIREAGSRTTWNAPDATFESAVHTWIDAVIDGPVAREITNLVTRIAPHGWSDSLGQKVIQLLGPGIPDVYQGTELWEDSLVDPDNRRLVDFALRRALIDARTPDVDGSGTAKMHVVRTALTLRREHPSWFSDGAYRPVHARGVAASHVLGFARGPQESDPAVVVLATRHSLVLTDHGWDETHIELPAGAWVDLLSGRPVSSTKARAVFAAGPCAILTRADRAS